MKTGKMIGCLAAACVALTFLGSCDKNDTPVFDAGYSALNIWFGTEGGLVDDETYNYSYTLGEGSLTFYARVAGVPVDYDRTFALEAYEGDLDETNGSIRTEEYVIKAGETDTKGRIYFDTSKLKNKDSFKDRDGSIRFRMVANERFEAGADTRNTLTVVLKNDLAKPTDWDAAKYPMMAYTRYFGAYSKVKYQFMIQTLGLVDFHISYFATVNYDEETNTLSDNYATFLRDKMRQALATYNNDPANGGPLTDESGYPVTF